MRQLFRRLEATLEPKHPIDVYLAGGMAVHLYTAGRVTTDVDAEFSGKVLIPNDLIVTVTLENGKQQPVYFDTNYNPAFALLHEDYHEDSIPVELGTKSLRLRVLSPVDLAVSKVARLADNDRQDIVALVRLGLTSAAAIEQRANDAMGGFVGGEEMLRRNLRDALVLARRAESGAMG